MDASTLGKIEVVGADAPAFLDRMYTNRMSNLAVGSIRYGLMLGLDGMVLDDGVAMRLADDRYLVTTTTGGAATVLDRFEEWLQTEWPDLRVYCTSVTEQWAVVAINGPRAREVVSATGTDVDLSREAFPFMTFRDGQVAGVPARLARVSFSGELAYELHVPAWHGLEIWEAVMVAGDAVRDRAVRHRGDARPARGEGLRDRRPGHGRQRHAARPRDGLDREPVQGRLRRPAFAPALRHVRPDRKQLVGLLPEGTRTRCSPRARQLVLEDTGRDPDAARGPRDLVVPEPGARAHVRARDARAGGHAMHGRTVYAPLPEEHDRPARSPRPIPYDPDGARRDG